MHPALQHDVGNGCHDQQTNGIDLFRFTYVLYNISMSHNAVVHLCCDVTTQKHTRVCLEEDRDPAFEAIWVHVVGLSQSLNDSILIIGTKCGFKV